MENGDGERKTGHGKVRGLYMRGPANSFKVRRNTNHYVSGSTRSIGDLLLIVSTLKSDSGRHAKAK